MARAAVLCGVLFAPPAVALEIRHVSHEPAMIEPRSGQPATISFRLTAPAAVALDVYDGRDLRVRRIASTGVLAEGRHQLRWDGTDGAGRPVPPEAYAYTLEAVARSGERWVWDVTDATGGKGFAPQEVAWDAAAKRLRYRLRRPARVRIRLGLQNDGPLLRTLIDWVPRLAGPHAEPWDGRDQARVLDLRNHPALAIDARAFALSENTILVGPPPGRVRLIDGLPEPTVRRPRQETRRKRMFDFASQPIEQRRDFPIRLELPDDLERTPEGVPIVSGPVPVRVEVDSAQLAAVLNQRCEAVFFVDGRLAFENEVGFLPMTWTWRPDGANPGTHYLSANLRGYEGYFGMTTIAVHVQPLPTPHVPRSPEEDRREEP